MMRNSRVHALLLMIAAMIAAVRSAAAQETLVAPAPRTPSAVSSSGSEIERMISLFLDLSDQEAAIKRVYGDKDPKVVAVVAAREELAKRMRDTVSANLASTTREFAGAQSRLRDRETSLRERTGRSSGWMAALADLEQQKAQLIIQIAGEQAGRDQAMRFLQQHQITDQPATNPAATEPDPIAKSLAALIEIRGKHVDLMKQEHDKGMASSSDLLTAEAALADAQLQSMERQQRAEPGDRADEAAHLQTTVVDMDVAISVKQATLDAVDEQLKRLTPAIAQIDELRMNQQQCDDALADQRRASIDSIRVDRALSTAFLPDKPNSSVTNRADKQPTTSETQN